MIAVLDASAGFELLTNSSAGILLRDQIENCELVMAPDLYVSEVTNVCWKAVKRRELSMSEAVSGLRLALSLVDIIKPASPLAIEALKEASTSGRTAYDLMYIILAKREGATLLTVDKGMLSLAKDMGVETAS